jgi:hypothetical protein
MTRFLWLSLFLVGFSPVSFAQSPAGYKAYCNSRFGYCLDYPRFMVPQPESGSGDGRVFEDRKTGATLTVWGRTTTNPDGGAAYTLAQQFAADLNQMKADTRRQITYNKQEKDFFVISGYVSGHIFYQKTVLQQDAFAYAVLEYPQAAKARYDEVSKQVFKSLR